MIDPITACFVMVTLFGIVAIVWKSPLAQRIGLVGLLIFYVLFSVCAEFVYFVMRIIEENKE
jgi:hypothetical protein